VAWVLVCNAGLIFGGSPKFFMGTNITVFPWQVGSNLFSQAKLMAVFLIVIKLCFVGCVTGSVSSGSGDRIPVHGTGQQRKQRWLRMWLKIALPLTIIVLVYLLLCNMEPAYKLLSMAGGMD